MRNDLAGDIAYLTVKGIRMCIFNKDSIIVRSNVSKIKVTNGMSY